MNKTDTSQQAEYQHDMNFYFWLGADGEAIPTSEIDFLDRIDDVRTERDDFLYCRTPDGDVPGSGDVPTSTCGCSCGGCEG